MSKSKNRRSDGVILSDKPNTTQIDRESYQLTPARAEHWARKQSWTQTEARRLARNCDPTLYKQRDKSIKKQRLLGAERNNKDQSLGKRKPNLAEQMRRARRRDLLHLNPTPREFINWLDEISYQAPEHLRKAVLQRNKKVADLRVEFDVLMDRMREEGLIDEVCKGRILKQLNPEEASNFKAEEAAFHRQEKRHLYGFVAAFAEQNGYKSGSNPSALEAVSEGLMRVGLDIKASATIKKYIADAYSIYGDKIKKSK